MCLIYRILRNKKTAYAFNSFIMKTLLLFLCFCFAGLNWVSAQWNRLNQLSTTKTLFSVCFPDENTGYASGADGTLLKTIDAGASWTPLVSNTTMYLESMSFMNADTGIITGASQDGGIILKTTDGGQTWTTRNFSTGSWYLGVHFVNERYGFVAGSWSNGNNGLLMKTTDGGNSWVGNYPSEAPLNSCFFLDSLTGYVVGDRGIILKTTDGAGSWSATTPTFRNLYDIFFTSYSTGYAAGAGILLKTTDAGATWTECPLLIYTDLLSIFFTSPSNGYVAGLNGIIYMTSDDGQSWTLSKSNTDEDLFSLHFIDANTGYASGANGTILKTVNAGALALNDNFVNETDLIITLNPAADEILLQTAFDNLISEIHIYDIAGKNVKSFEGDMRQINCSDLQSGVYVVQVVTEKYTFRKKVVIN